MKVPIVLVFTILIFLTACTPGAPKAIVGSQKILKTGCWRTAIKIDESNPELEIAFLPDDAKKTDKYRVERIHANGQISITFVSICNNPVFITFPIFDAEIKAISEARMKHPLFTCVNRVVEVRKYG